ncbi:MAG: MFS transporter [Opitutaceae bacterium]|nr:MFS transporter [Opitutaceae bacterium]
MAFIDGTALSVALPALQTDLKATGASLLWVTNGFSLPLAALLLFGGALGDAFGRRRIFGLGILIFVSASVACGLAPGIEVLVGARMVQGVGGALMIPGSLALISSHYPAEVRGKAIGTWSAFSVLATTLGPVLGGLLAGAGLWRAVFFINVPLAAVALAVVWFKIPAEPAGPGERRVDWWGAALVTAGLAGVNHGLIQWPKSGLGDPQVLVPLAGGALALAGFLLLQQRVREPLLPLDIFRSRPLCAACLLSFLFYMGFHGTLFFMPLNLVQVQGYAPMLAGLTQLPLMALLILLSRWAGRLVDQRGPRLPLTVGPIVAGMGFLSFALPGLTAGPGAFWTTFLPGFLLVGVGLGLTATPLSTAVMDSVPPARLGLASGVNSSVTRLAGVFAIAVLGPVMLGAFGWALESRVAGLGLSPDALAQLRLEAAKLAVAQPPPGLPAEVTHAVQQAIRGAFVEGFRLVVAVAAGLCWLGAAMAAWGLRPAASGGRPGARRTGD